jgi:ligand-binding sensor domain-containing protein
MNRISYRYISLILHLNACVICSNAQILSSPFITKTYTAQDGLPHSYIYALLQDSKGYLWVGTRYGLGRFDGHSFTNIRLNDIGANSVISWLHEDEKEKMWIQDGTGIYTLESGKLSLYKNIAMTPVIKENNNRPSEIWARSDSEMYRIDNYSYIKPVPIPDFLNDQCRRATFTPEGNYFSLTGNIIFVNKQGDKKTIVNLNGVIDFVVILGYWDNQLYFYSNYGVYAYSNGQIRALFQNQLKGKHIFCAYKDFKNRFWVATEQGGILISKAGEENEFSYSIKPSHNLISSFYEDKEGNVWIAGFEGLIKVQENKFEIFSDKEYPFLSDLNLAAKDNEGTIFFFSGTNGVNGFSRWHQGKFSFDEGNSLKGQLIDILCLDNKNRFWCISRQNKIILLNKGQLSFISDTVLNSTDDFEPDIVYDDYREKVWLPGKQLLCGDENKFVVFKDAKNKIIKDPRRMLYMNNGKIIVSTASDELILINSTNETLKINTPANFSPGRIYRFYSDSSGNIWISYPGMGLLQCRLLNDSSLNIVNKFSTESGLTNDFIQSLTFDQQGRLWLSTMAGIAVLDFKNKAALGVPIYLFGNEEGIPASGLEYGRLVCDDNGDMWYSTQNALMKFRVSEMKFGNQPPQVTIENILLNNKETNWKKYTDSLKGVFQLPVNPKMKYFENTITISFKAATMTNAENVQYSYLLTGINDSWSNSSKTNTITFTKLNSGNYTFFVRARTNNMSWSTPALFSFTIRKPYWQQWWFIALSVMTGAGIIYLGYRIRVGQLKKEKQIRDQIASDLHDDLGSTLNSVKVYSNVASIEKDNKQYLEKINENTLEAISSLRDIIWVLDEKKDTIEHLFNRINLFALPLCEANDIQFVQQVHKSINTNLLGREEKRNLFMIIKEAINNSIKYADCKTISLSAIEEKKKLIILISDDGKGYIADTLNEGHGIKNILRRSAEIHYLAKIDSLNGKGTSIRLEKR